MNNNYAPGDILRLKDVLAIVPVSRSTWLRGVDLGTYPAPIRLSERRIGWLKTDIEDFIEGLK